MFDLFMPAIGKKKEPAPLELNLPRGWNALTIEQLEEVSRILIDTAKKNTATGQWDRADMMTRCFFAVSGLEAVGLIHEPEEEFSVAPPALTGDDEADEELQAQYQEARATYQLSNSWYNCRFKDVRERVRRQTYEGKIRPIKITVGEIMYVALGYDKLGLKGTPTHVDGPLAWILSPSDLTNFPYYSLRLPDMKEKGKLVELRGPEPLMDGMTWRQYRFTSDYVQYLTKVENQLATMERNAAKYGSARLERQRKAVNEVRSQFLANIFCRKVKHNDPETGQPKTDFFFVSTQSSDNAYLFANFPIEKYQCVLLWWQGMMRYLQHRYPKVFRTEKNISKVDPMDDPLKLYSRSTATMIKYAAETEEEVNRTTYTVVLQQMNDMAEENDRIKEMNKKHK